MTLQVLTRSDKNAQKKMKKRPLYVKFKIVPFGTRAYIESVILREEVLRKPLGMKFKVEDLRDEEDQIHLTFWDNKQCIATAILKPLDKDKVQLRQMAVKEEYQGQGIGSALLAIAEKIAKNEDYKIIILDARLSAINFYKKHNYSQIGEQFRLIGLPHVKMMKILI